MKVSPLTSEFGRVLSGGGSPIDAVPRSDVLDLFAASGALLFRGFAVDDAAFVAFTEAFGRDFVVNGEESRESVGGDGKTQTVNAGNGIIPLHAEMGYSPFRPEILWLHCVRPAARAGETLVADGVQIWKELPEALRRAFAETRLRYRFEGVPPQFINLYINRAATAEAALAALAGVPGLACSPRADGLLDVDYVVEAAPPPRFGGAPAFANSVIVEDRTVSFEDGRPVGHEMRMELFDVASRCAFPLKWRAGDVLMVDNSRMMHGRAPFTDPERRIHVRMGRAAA